MSTPEQRAAWFDSLAQAGAAAMGSPWYLLIIAGLILLTALLGYILGALVSSFVVLTTIFTVTTEVKSTLVLNTQHRQEQAMQMKLDALIRGIESANNAYLRLEDRSPAEIERLSQESQEPPPG